MKFYGIQSFFPFSFLKHTMIQKKQLHRLALAAACLLPTFALSQKAEAQECEIGIDVAVMEQDEAIPEAAAQVFTNSLNRLATDGGMSLSAPYNQFYLTARFDVLDKHIVGGAPTQVVYNLGVTYYIVDNINRKKFASSYVEVNGVGTNETKALISAFRHLNAQNTKVKKMLSDGRAQILNYFNSQYPNILKEAQRLANLQKYDEAIALCVSIPSCSAGGDQAVQAGLNIYNRYRDKLNLQQLNKARALWAATQTQESAGQVAELLSLIDPEASCYNDALSLAQEVKKQVRSDLNFEMRQKYNDSVKLEEQRIAALRAVGVAYGNGQKAQTTNIAWVR